MGTRRGAAVAASAVLIAFLVSALAACAPAATDALPQGVSVSITQSRSDYSSRTIGMRVSNASDADIPLVRAALHSPQFVAAAVWERGTVLRAGTTVDLRVPLPDAQCPPQGETDAAVTLEYVVDGNTRTGRAPAPDPLERLVTINAEDCLARDVAAVAAITAAPEIQWTPGAREPAAIDLRVAPAGGTGSLRVMSVDDTVLLAVVDAAGEKVQSLPLDATVRGSDAASVITVRFVPNRCDPHAVLEDKRGTFLPLNVETESGAAGVIFVGVTDAVRGAIYDYVGDYCGF